ncbi:uncharacterized protein MONOS_12681 [Monocercomonoides exilis]|uniref:uncharacterized protein n=1 Tax=Monocercomonoides exilis TaxID=2049356 RepID=UPI00355A32CB|nr:hypothetical protein MONOS_12681 [Monocercomonoides exilis]|eukprot:MONOS_12681.1-p1 / transcript=MONOS_12681.1 / gene=MONOS_12681 / organism=Monocercomonoides_exilis_PA203 / gene_product=unspecified product / transcript_product=unspecified product / location=Mono_scaffold00718:22740-23236(-) / protein_length=143 / sequence_SO=supercontig / SO=protein_coding / is_pseudo=false
MSDMRNEKIVRRASGTVMESPIGSALEENSKTAIADILEGEVNKQMQETSEQDERVEEDWGRQTSEPWYKSSMEKPPVPNLTRGEKTQTGVSGNYGDDEELFIPLGGGIEGLSGEAHTGVGGEVVQPDIHVNKEERESGERY